MSRWSFLTNHGFVLLCLARNQDALLREIAEEAGITERAVHHIIRDLTDAGYVIVHKRGRRNHYEINRTGRLRHPSLQGLEINELLEALLQHHG